MKYKPTDKDLEIFKKECLRLADLWELNNWTYRFNIQEDGDYEEAWITRCIDNLQADLHLCSASYPIEEQKLKESARHEMSHVLIGELHGLGKCREFNLNEYMKAEEQLVHKLEKLLPKD